MTDYARPELGDVDIDVAPRHPAPPGTPAGTVPHEYMFSTPMRHATVAIIAASIPVIAVVMWAPRDPVTYLRQMVVVSALYALPGLVLAVIGAVRGPERDRIARWLWAGVFGLGCLGLVTSYPRLRPDMDPSVWRTTIPILFSLVILMAANTLLMRSRSGQRAALVDGVDLVMATIALLAPFGLAFGPAILGASRSWFTAAAALWLVVACHGTLVALTIRPRLEPQHRSMVNMGVLFGVAVMVSCAASAWYGVRDFDLPSGPFAALYAASIGLGVLFFVYSPRHSSPGLERLPATAQVRRSSLIAVVVLGSVPLVGAAVWVQRSHAWVPEIGLFTVLVLLTLSTARHLLAARETTRLYDLVDQSAQERGKLLGEVMAHVDTDRHRAAAHLHRQAASLYAAMAAFTSAINQAAETGNPSAMRFAAERLRRDLGQRADGLQRLAEAVKPIQPSGEDARRLAAPMRAFLENLAVDGPRPELDIDVDPDLVLDWTTEAAVLRIVQEATLHAWWSNCARHVHVAVSASHAGVRVEVVDDGSRDPGTPTMVVDTLGSMARFLGGELSTTALPEGGTRVSATIPVAMTTPSEQRTPHLRLVGTPAPEVSSTGGRSLPDS